MIVKKSVEENYLFLPPIYLPVHPVVLNVVKPENPKDVLSIGVLSKSSTFRRLFEKPPTDTRI